MRLLPYISEEKEFALKGGTAINLFVRNMPRLSVDIDLVYLPLKTRVETLSNISQALLRIEQRICRDIPSARVDSLPLRDSLQHCVKKVVYAQNAQVKIEVSPVIRGTVHPCRILEMSAAAKEQFGFVSMQVVSFADLYAGKICAALHRQNPRDLFDIDLLLKNEGIDEKTWGAFLVYLISDDRPIAELLAPKQLPLRPTAIMEFQKMTAYPVSAHMLEQARQNLVLEMHGHITDEQKQFLISFKKGDPQWEFLKVPGVKDMPAVRWKLENLSRMPKDKHQIALRKLMELLYPQ